ncbi:hypothetical protein RZS08_47585, partial [Arthrospira platensis SPKY1]|nr:hypothetical protein [Arthrospira platensis SPKY1]
TGTCSGSHRAVASAHGACARAGWGAERGRLGAGAAATQRPGASSRWRRSTLRSSSPNRTEARIVAATLASQNPATEGCSVRAPTW